MIELPVPKRLVIGPHEYEVSFDHDILLSDGHNGQISYRKQYIKFDTNEKPTQLNVILLHEVLHGICEVFGVEISEADNDRLANGLSMFLKDNFGAGFTFEGIDGK
jgi:hypothetical protein